MAGGPVVRRGVAARRAVTAADVAAGLADAKVNPAVLARSQAVLAAGGGRRDVLDLVEVGTRVSHGMVSCPSPPDPNTTTRLAMLCERPVDRAPSRADEETLRSGS